MFCFVGTEDEINTRPVLEDLLKRGKQVGVPKCISKGIMEVYKIRSFDDLEPGKYGILEPKEGCEKISPKAIHLALIPCLSCSMKGERLGYGGGYYDRYLETHPGHKTIALAYEFQILHELPAEPYDKSVDMIVTEKRVIRCSIK